MHMHVIGCVVPAPFTELVSGISPSPLEGSMHEQQLARRHAAPWQSPKWMCDTRRRAPADARKKKREGDGLGRVGPEHVGDLLCAHS